MLSMNGGNSRIKRPRLLQWIEKKKKDSTMLFTKMSPQIQWHKWKVKDGNREAKQTLAIPSDRRNSNIKVEFKERKIARDKEWNCIMLMANIPRISVYPQKTHKINEA